MKRKNIVQYFMKNLGVMVGIVLIWRGIWYLLDALDAALFGGTHIFTAIVGVIVGFLILYLPDHDLKEISRL